MTAATASVDYAALPRLSMDETQDLEPGTRLRAFRSGEWRGAEVVARPPTSSSSRMLMQFDDAGLGLGWNGRARYSTLDDEDTYYWHDRTVSVVLDPDANEGETVSRFTFPATPTWTDYWEPPARPRRVDQRWIMTMIHGHVFHILYMGDCLACGSGTYSSPNGANPQSVMNRALVVVKDGEKRVRFCFGCARSASALAHGLENAKASEDTAPLAWPEGLDFSSTLPGNRVLDIDDDDEVLDIDDDDEDDDEDVL